MKKLIEYKYEKPISIIIKNKTIYLLTEPYIGNIEILNNIDRIQLYIKDTYTYSYIADIDPPGTQTVFNLKISGKHIIHGVSKIEVYYCPNNFHLQYIIKLYLAI